VAGTLSWQQVKTPSSSSGFDLYLIHLVFQVDFFFAIWPTALA